MTGKAIALGCVILLAAACKPGGTFYVGGDGRTGCGNGVIDPGETCDPASTCPSTCRDANPCTLDMLQGGAETCDALCSFEPITACGEGDGCCPAGCSPSNDGDCSTTCGNGTLEPGETCDPPDTCPEDCVDGDACTRDLATGSAENCNVLCSFVSVTACEGGDGCCPAGCDAGSDDDCSASCGDGVIDPGETCDPPDTCPAACDDGNDCTADTLRGSAANCNASCSHSTVTECLDGDGCCPAGCDAGSDDDCSASCGDGVIDPGETCDPPATCPTDCDDDDPCTGDMLTGSAANCNADCAHSPVTGCLGGDGCCPSGCNSGSDSDCSATCGNGVIDSGETCDPPSTCPTGCDDDDPCTSDSMSGSAANCNVSCSHSDVTACINGDGCCPSGCNSGSDSDCSPACGNGVIDSGETCDPPSTCPADCDDDDPCTSDTMSGSASTCNAACSHSDVTACTNGDGCCPSGCNSGSDSDCSPTCGNGVIDSGETCDPPSTCPTSCSDGDPCTSDTLTGSASTCTAACTYPDVTACTNGDGCCPSGCNATNDSECTPVCGNGVVESGETCDPPSSCPATCDDGNACTTDGRSGSATSCNVVCTHDPVTACTGGDGCCPATCTPTSDSDCIVDCRDAGSWPSGWATFETQVVTLVNTERADGHVCGTTSYPPAGPVTMNAQLREAARCHSLDMAVNDFFSHTGSDGSQFWDRCDAAGYTGSPLGENIGAGYTTPAAVVAGWMASPGHCANIMAASANEIGVGYVYESDSTWRHYWTMVTGRR